VLLATFGHVSGPRGEYRKTAQRRAEIIDAAYRVFAQSGYTAGSVTEIAKTVGISATGVMHHFRGGKPELLTEVLEHRDLLDIANIAGRSGRELLRGLIDISRMQSGQPGLVQLHAVLAAEASEPTHPGHATLSRRFTNITETVHRAFDEVAAGGGLRPQVDARRAALSTLAMIEGLGLLWMYQLDVDLAADLQLHIESFLTEPLNGTDESGRRSSQ